MSNILFFMTDQQHADCLSYVGHPLVKTPNLDRLAARSCVFRQMYTCTAICSPSRTSFFTGTYLNTHGHAYNDGDLFRPLPGMADIFKKQGYTTYQCGKNHLPASVSAGFDRCDAMAEYHQALKDAGLDMVPPELRENPALRVKRFESYTSALPEEWTSEMWTSQRAIDFLESDRSKGKPWFMWCSFERPHAPHCPPASFDDMYDPDRIDIDWEGYHRFHRTRLGNRAMVEDFWNIGGCPNDLGSFKKAICRYFALITLIDREVGRVLEALEAQGMAQDTIIVFTSDHGDFAGNYGALGKNLPGYDHLLRIPFIYHDPKRNGDDGQYIQGLYQSVDLLPSLLERLNMPIPPTVQGRSFLPALDGYPGSSREYVFAETSMMKTIRSNDWKLNFYGVHPEKGQLFRMGHEPDELTNLWDEPGLTHIRQRLMEQLTGWLVGCSQHDSMSPRSEVYVKSRWYDWLHDQPGRAVTSSPR